MTIRILFFLFISLMLSVTGGLAESVDVATAEPNSLTAEQVLDRHLSAIGGEAAVKAVDSVTRSGELHFESPFTGVVQGTVEYTIVNRRKLHRSSDLGAFSTVTGWDGTTAWEQGAQGLRELTGPELDAVVGQADLFFTTGLWRDPETGVELLADESLDGVLHRVVRFDGGGFSGLKVFFDAETYYVSQIVLPMELPGMGKAIAVTDFWDYREHAGVMMPDVIGMSIEGVFSTESRIQQTTVNGKVDDALFAMPR